MSIYSDAVLAEPSLALYWRHGEPSGTTADDASGNGRTGTYVGGVTVAQAGLLTGDPDTAIDLNGTTGFVRSAYNPFTNGTTRTFEGWANRDVTGAVHTLFGGVANPCPELTIASAGPASTVNFKPNRGFGGAGDLAAWAGAWPGAAQRVHWVLIFNESADTAELYINGVSQGVVSGLTRAYPASPGNFISGSVVDGATQWFDGKHDEVAVYEAALSGARILEHFTVGITGPPVILPQIHVREKPPLRHSVSLTSPVGRHYRWGEDEPDPANVPSGLRYSDTVPGGYETADATLPRKPGLDYPDLERLTDWRVLGVGGQRCWGGRLERAPRTSGDEVSVSPSAVGHVALLEDDKSAREIYRNIDLNGWTGPSVQRRIDLDAAGNTARDPSVQPDATSGEPSLRTGWEGDWPATEVPSCEALYDSQGIPLGSLYYAWKRGANVSAGPNDWFWDAQLGTTDVFSSFDTTGDLQAAGPSSGTLAATAADRVFGLVRLLWNAASAQGTAQQAYDIWWTFLALYGGHGLTLRGTEPDAGFYASDVVRHAVQTWAPSLQIKPDSVQQSSFVIPHLAFLDATTAGEIVRQASRFDLPDWGVWDDRVFVWHEPGARGRTWRLRIGPSQLEETGKSVERLWESVIVSYQDVDGSTRTVGPPGSGADTESSDLKDSDPDNPANKLGITRRDRLQMGTSTAAGATEVGRRFLEQSRLLDRSGKARVVGWAEDDRGVLHPFSAVQSGDFAVFVDAADTSPRKIIRTEKDHDSRTCTMDLDAPPEGLAQLLERLQVVLVPLGV